MKFITDIKYQTDEYIVNGMVECYHLYRWCKENAKEGTEHLEAYEEYRDEILRRMKTIMKYPSMLGKSTHLFSEVIANSLNGEVVMYATPKGNVIVVEEMKFERMTK